MQTLIVDTGQHAVVEAAFPSIAVLQCSGHPIVSFDKDALRGQEVFLWCHDSAPIAEDIHGVAAKVGIINGDKWPDDFARDPPRAARYARENVKRFVPSAAKSPAPLGLPVDLTLAEHFLTFLDEDAESFTFQTFDDHGKDKRLARIFHGSLTEHAEALTALNSEGAGVFVTINATDGRGRKVENIQHVRAVFVDLDGAPLAPVQACGLEPHFILETSPGRWHCYWRVDGLPLEEFAQIQRAIAARFGGDVAVCDLPRVMRLAGFLHRKGPPFLARTVHESGTLPYSAPAIRAAFPSAPPVTAPTTASENATRGVNGAVVAENRHADLLKLAAHFAREVHNNGLAKESAIAAMVAEAQRGRWTREIPDDELRRALDGALSKYANGQWESSQSPHANERTLAVSDALTPVVEFIPFADLDGQTPPPRKWVIENWAPESTTTLVVGTGGIGKTITAIQACVSAAAGVPFLGNSVKRGPAIGLFAEDDRDEIWRRTLAICRAQGLALSNIAHNLRFQARAGLRNEMVGFDREHGLVLTALAYALEEEIARVEPVLVVIDNVAQMFAGNEVDRYQVTAFVNWLTGLAVRHHLAVLLLAHPAKNAASEYSGSTAWENAVRSRWWMEREKDGDAGQTGRIFLRRRKANYAGEDALTMRYDDGFFRRCDGAAADAAELAEQRDRATDAEYACIAAIHTLNDKRIGSHESPRSTKYLCKQMVRYTLTRGHSEKELSAALARMIGSGRVLVDRELWKNAQRHPVMGLVLAEHTQNSNPEGA